MPLPQTTRADIDGHLDELHVERGDNVLVHTRILSFGRIVGGIDTLGEALLDRVGPEGTIIVPTYTLDAGTTYDRASTPSQGVGALSEWLRTRSGAVRSRCPMHNHSGIGAKSSVLEKCDGTVSLGAGSDFAAMEASGFKMLLLGCDLSESATYLIHLEAIAGVPYRAMIPLERQIRIEGGTQTTIKVNYFGIVDRRWAQSFDQVKPELLSSGSLVSARLPLGSSYVAQMGALSRFVLQKLSHNPFYLVAAQ